MKKVIYSFILFLASLFITQNVDAAISNNNFFDPSQYDFSTEWEKINNDYGEVNNRIIDIKETNDGGLILVMNYKESLEKIAGIDPTTNQFSGTYTLQRDHAKLVKLNANYEIEWITKYYVPGNWAWPDPLAPTVQTTFNKVVVLPDDSIIAGGKVWGYQSSSTTISSGDAFFIRVSKTGEIIYKYNYQLNGIKNVENIGYTEDGKYVIAYEYENDKSSEHPDFATTKGILKPDNFNVSESGIYYVIYDKNNQIIESFYETEKDEMLKKYSFNDMFTYTLQDKGEYIGIDNRGYILYRNYDKLDDNKWYTQNLYFYDPTNMTLVNKFAMPNGLESIFFTNKGNLLIGDKIYDVYGTLKGTYSVSSVEIEQIKSNEEYFEKLMDHYWKFGQEVNASNFSFGSIHFVKKNGDLIHISYKNYQAESQYFSGGGYDRSILNIKETDSSNKPKDLVKFIINNEEITYNLGTFIENDRIYIKLSNLCYVMDCSYQKGVGDNNKMLVIKFNATLGNKMLDLSHGTSDGLVDYYNNIFYEENNRLMYTITHEIGTKNYHAYLEYQPYAVFTLKSPTYNANAVDVASKEIDGDIYVPIRFISEAMGRYVDYTPATENEKAIVTIHSYGDGEFFEKYALAASTSKLSDGDTITNIQGHAHPSGNEITKNITYVELPWENPEYLYGYGYEVETNKVVSVEKTMWLYGTLNSKNTLDDFLGILPYDGRDQLHHWAGGGDFNGKYNVLLVEVNKNVLGKGHKFNNDDITNLQCHENENGEEICEESDYIYEDINKTEYSFFLISNIEGYPFIKYYSLY